ncbi:hypothetical protein [Luteolibacter sp. Populi]|uniref:hypothetical protein n=1 Tax=Luteolibacter sp. Populi TaxID=3230487 RepID=UPI003464FD00
MQLHPEWLAGSASSSGAGLRGFRELALSDEVLGTVVSDANLLSGSETKEESIAEIRPLIMVDPVSGTPLAEIRIKGKKTSRTDQICKALIRDLAKRAGEIDLAAHEKAYQKVKERRAELIRAVHEKKAEILGSTPDPAGSPTDRTAAADRSQLKQIHAEFEQVSLELIEKQAPLLPGGRDYIRELPQAAPKWLKRDFLGIATRGVLWIGWSIVAALALAYVLERLLPGRRRAIDETQESPDP